MYRYLISIFLCFFLLLSGCSEDDNSTDPGDFDGKIFQEGDIKVVILGGSYFEMGQQLGRLMRPEIYELYQAMIIRRLSGWGLTENQMVNEANLLWDTVIPPWQKALCDGLALTSDLDLNQVKILQTWRQIVMELTGCSAAIIWDEYSADGSYLVGGNIDDSDAGDYKHLICITVFNPTGANHRLASIGYPGVFDITAGINDAGLCVQQNSAPMAYVFTDYDLSRPWRSILSFEWLRDCGSVDDVGMKYRLAEVAIGCNYLAADPDNAACLETAQEEILERSYDLPGYLCETNHFVHDFLQNHNDAYFEDLTSESTYIRRNNLISKIEGMKGNLDGANLMNSILLVSEGSGGVMNNTAISFTYKPFQNRLLVAVPGVTNPVEINMNTYFYVIDN